MNSRENDLIEDISRNYRHVDYLGARNLIGRCYFQYEQDGLKYRWNKVRAVIDAFHESVGAPIVPVNSFYYDSVTEHLEDIEMKERLWTKVCSERFYEFVLGIDMPGVPIVPVANSSINALHSELPCQLMEVSSPSELLKYTDSFLRFDHEDCFYEIVTKSNSKLIANLLEFDTDCFNLCCQCTDNGKFEVVRCKEQ